MPLVKPWMCSSEKLLQQTLFDFPAGRLMTPGLSFTAGRFYAYIAETESSIWFDIELDVSFNSLDVEGYDLELAGQSDVGHSIIRFSVDKAQNTDEDDDQWNCVIPFQVAYAVSIHRAQGLEYQSVKIVITNEVEE